MLKGKIDKYGKFFIWRSSEYTLQSCPLSQPESFCGDWCPQFGEPLRIQIQSKIDMIKQFKRSIDDVKAEAAEDPDEFWSAFSDWQKRPVDLRICQNRILYFEEFIDERPKE